MKRLYYLLFLILGSASVLAQEGVKINPTITPSLVQPSETITVTYDVTGTTLTNLTDAYLWAWIPNISIDAKFNVNPANTNTSLTNQVKFTKQIANGRTLFVLSFKPSDLFTSDISAQSKMGILLKGNDWANGKTQDFLIDFGFVVSLTQPTQKQLFVSANQTITVEAKTPAAATYTLYVNGVEEITENNLTTFSHGVTIPASPSSGTIRVVAQQDNKTSEASFHYVISAPSEQVSKPAGIIQGINYHADPTKVTLCLLAPEKSSVYVRGDFNDWKITPSTLMKRDGELFWIELSGLESQKEYGFQYVVDEAIYIADPYADKILDPLDEYIPASIYPNLKSYPTEARFDDNQWYFNRVSVFQTNQTPYQWKVNNFQKPAKEKLIIYELLIRDFFAQDQRSYNNLIDTISYLKRLGVNAVELLPIMEFNGNESWGYNPTFMFAPDKAYGTKNKLKEFIDECHANGIAVILDIAMNHQDMPNPFVLMDFNFAITKPNPTNKWFNVDAKHPFNVFFDMNHESEYTKRYLDTVNYYWLNEYKIDGYRFDLTKGFTQTNNPNNEPAWSSYDASRIAILKRMSDKIWENFPDAYVIFEHLGGIQEEKELAEHRSNEGKGIMLWGKMTDPYNQSTMGYGDNSDLRGVYYESRNMTVPHLVSYMESHDEERLMFKNITYGNASGTYSTKAIPTGLARVEAASTMFYLVPGPKMLWQFGELGYDYSINYCEDGSIKNDCRVSAKPVTWDYLENSDRRRLFNHTADLISLKKSYPVFSNGKATFTGGNNLQKQITIVGNPYNPNPSSADEMNAVLVANFELTEKTISVTLPHAGNWYDYYNHGRVIVASGTTISITLPPGTAKIFTDVFLEESPITAIQNDAEHVDWGFFPNPTNGELTLSVKDFHRIQSIRIYNTQGMQQPFTTRENNILIHDLKDGLYLLELVDQSGFRSIKKVIKKS
jgi:1,4-alpha-glucan branching enzyme